jgi:myosin heavy subunit
MALVIEGEGVPDFVLLDELTEDALFENLKIRYHKNKIYT